MAPVDRIVGEQSGHHLAPYPLSSSRPQASSTQPSSDESEEQGANALGQNNLPSLASVLREAQVPHLRPEKERETEVKKQWEDFWAPLKEIKEGVVEETTWDEILPEIQETFFKLGTLGVFGMPKEVWNERMEELKVDQTKNDEAWEIVRRLKSRYQYRKENGQFPQEIAERTVTFSPRDWPVEKYKIRYRGIKPIMDKITIKRPPPGKTVAKGKYTRALTAHEEKEGSWMLQQEDKGPQKWYERERNRNYSDPDGRLPRS